MYVHGSMTNKNKKLILISSINRLIFNNNLILSILLYQKIAHCEYLNSILYIYIKLTTSMGTKEKVLETMKNSGTPLRTGEIAKLSNLDKKDIDKAMQEVKTEGKIFSPKRCFWQAK